MKIAKDSNADTIKPPELVTFVQKVKNNKKTQTLIKIYKDETTITRTLCFFHDADKKTRHKVFSHEWTDYPSSLFEVDPTLDQGYVMRKGCKSDFLKAVTLHVDDKYEQPSV